MLPVPTVPPNSPNQNQNQLFTYEQTIFIISGYKERKAKFLSPTHKKKALWSEITENLNKAYAANFSVAQVEGRWKTQLSAFKRHQGKIEKMHKEKMEIFSGFLSVLRNMKD